MSRTRAAPAAAAAAGPIDGAGGAFSPTVTAMAEAATGTALPIAATNLAGPTARLAKRRHRLRLGAQRRSQKGGKAGQSTDRHQHDTAPGGRRCQPTRDVIENASIHCIPSPVEKLIHPRTRRDRLERARPVVEDGALSTIVDAENGSASQRRSLGTVVDGERSQVPLRRPLVLIYASPSRLRTGSECRFLGSEPETWKESGTAVATPPAAAFPGDDRGHRALSHLWVVAPVGGRDRAGQQLGRTSFIPSNSQTVYSHRRGPTAGSRSATTPRPSTLATRIRNDRRCRHPPI